MPKTSSNFDQMKHVADWKKKNMLSISAKYNKEFVLEFREACKQLGIGTSDVIRKVMEETIAKAKKKRRQLMSFLFAQTIDHCDRRSIEE